jgi:hypothetical protein
VQFSGAFREFAKMLSFILAALGISVCYFAYLIQLIMKDRVGLAAVFFFTGGIGQICAYFHGWSTAREWNNRRLMVAWTVILVVFILFILMFLGTILAFLSHRFPHS